MSIPATITTAAVWPDLKLSIVGPFESGSTLYVFGVDTTNNKIRAYASTDKGHTWSEQDASNAPASATTANYKTFTASLDGTTVHLYIVLSSSSMQIKPFSCSSNTWQTALTGPTITINQIPGVAAALLGVRRSDGSFVIVYQGATEGIMGNQYARLKLHYRSAGGTWNGPYDVAGSANSPLANTLPGTQTHVELRNVVLGSSDRVIVLYANYSVLLGSATADELLTRTLTSSSVFAATPVSTGMVIHEGHLFGVGHPCTYTVGSATMVAVPYLLEESFGQSIFPIQVARCDTANSHLAASWSVEETIPEEQGTSFGTPSNWMVMARDGDTSDKLWYWQVGRENATISYMHDAGAATWQELAEWRRDFGVLIGGLNAQPISGGVGLCYYDRLGVPAVSQDLDNGDHRIGYSNTNNEVHAAQGIRFSTAKTIKGVQILIRGVQAEEGSSAGMDIAIETDDSGEPSGTRVGLGIGASWFTGPGGASIGGRWASGLWGTLDPPDLAADTDYWLTVRNTAGTVLNADTYTIVRTYDSNVYSGGHFAAGNTTGGWTQYNNRDLTFRLFTVEDSPSRLIYDLLRTPYPKLLVGVGVTSNTVDLGEQGAAMITVQIDVGDNADPAGTIELLVEGSWDDGAYWPLANAGPMSFQSIGTIGLNSVPRYIRLTTTITGATSPVGITII